MTRQPLTASQTVGPFFHDGLLCAELHRNTLAPAEAVGDRVRIEGRVLDGDGQVVPDALIEIWQADHQGHYHHSGTDDLPLDIAFNGFGRTGTDAAGAYWFETIKPGRVAFDENTLQSPHICVAVLARGLLNHLYTRIYFADDPANAEDPVLRRVPVERQRTLLAQPDSEGGAGVVYRFDIVLQGAGETVFFNI
ncbi:MAG: protocatechuate 3,4-dioxygenase subunit alpha [Pyrinomonadaceae bacterium]|nr:protocatechuate 3,4-dioxygenase subunit alpha [Pyrinomonadaceae bacterium]